MTSRTSLDGCERQRIYLFRHGDVIYVDDEGRRAPNMRDVRLTTEGRAQAKAMAEWMADVPLDKAHCSGLPRTRETAERVLAGRDLPITEDRELEEIRVNLVGPTAALNPINIAYGFSEAHLPGARFGEGELFAEFAARVTGALERVLAEEGWHSLALFAHGGTNRIILNWALDRGLQDLGAFEQDMLCLNVIDLDRDPDTRAIRRRIIRAVNVTTYDTTKKDKTLTTLESVAIRAASKRKD